MFSQLSIEITKKLSSKEKKDNGIFFTPPSSINKMIKSIDFTNIKNILEPSCGSCEIVINIDDIINSNIDCIEYNKNIYNAIKDLQFKNNVTIMNEDFLLFNPNKKYDLIIGNPPYYVMKKHLIDKKYHKYFDGRPNIFIIFIIKCLELLNDNGYLSFVLPASFLNCLYYDKTRRYIYENFKIVDIINCDDDKYLETNQETIIITIQKKSSTNKKYVININDYIIFNTIDNIKKLKKLYKNSVNFDSLGFNVSIGKVVWNQVKNKLTNDSKKTLLIYSGDIKDNVLKVIKYSNPEKKNYINMTGYKTPCLVINRGYGVGQYNFNYCVIDIKEEYLVENHLIQITPREEYKTSFNKKELLKLYEKIIKSFNNDKTKEFIKLYLKNNAINIVELSYILPIYLD